MRKELHKIILNGLKHSQREQQLNVSDNLLNALSEKLTDSVFRRLELIDTSDRRIFESLVFSLLSKHSKLDLNMEENIEKLSVRIANIFYGEEDGIQ